MRARLQWLAAMLALPLLGGAASAPDELALLTDIRHASSADIDALKNADGVDWWLELGDQLLLVGERPALRQIGSVRASIDLADIRSDRLALHARGCADHATDIGTPIAEAGRWEVRQLSAGDAMPSGDEWLPVTRNSVLARRWRVEDHDLAAADPRVQAIVDAVDPARWFADVTTLAGWNRHSYNTAQLALARDWIGSRFSALGLAVTIPPFTAGSPAFTASNVIGTWTGTRAPDEWIIVGGHYDSRNATSGSSAAAITNAPGAEDNASGCSGVIELARVIVATQPERSVLFMCYAGEEQNLFGSKAHVTALQAAGDLTKVKHAMIMDMIGYSATPAVEVLLESNVAQQAIIPIYATAASTYVPGLGVVTATNANGSDHVPYLNAGRSSLLTIENDWNVYPHYHRSTDTPANMGANALAMGGAILRMNAAVLAELTRGPDRLFANGFDSTSP